MSEIAYGLCNDTCVSPKLIKVPTDEAAARWIESKCGHLFRRKDAQFGDLRYRLLRTSRTLIDWRNEDGPFELSVTVQTHEPYKRRVGIYNPAEGPSEFEEGYQPANGEDGINTMTAAEFLAGFKQA